MPDFARQRRALADFGRFALTSNDVDAVLLDACRGAAAGLGQKFAKVVESVEGREKLYIRACVGFEIAEEDRRIDAGEGSSAGVALAEGKPYVSSDASADPRFQLSDFVRKTSIRSLTNVPIPNPDPDPEGPDWWGVLEVDSTETGAFTGDELEFLQLYAALIGASVVRQKAIGAMRESLTAKDLLLRELQHRVKNNFAMIGATLRLEQQRSKSSECSALLDSVQGRLEVLTLVHDHLYRNYDVQRVEIEPYLRELSRQVSRIHAFGARKLAIDCSIASFSVKPDQAVALGQVVSEFITNSAKHAFDQAGGRITLDLREEGKKRVLTLVDNGRGLPSEIRSGTGMRLIEGIARQLGGEAEWEGDGGTRLTITF